MKKKGFELAEHQNFIKLSNNIQEVMLDCQYNHQNLQCCPVYNISTYYTTLWKT